LSLWIDTVKTGASVDHPIDRQGSYLWSLGNRPVNRTKQRSIGLTVSQKAGRSRCTITTCAHRPMVWSTARSTFWSTGPR